MPRGRPAIVENDSGPHLWGITFDLTDEETAALAQLLSQTIASIR